MPDIIPFKAFLKSPENSTFIQYQEPCIYPYYQYFENQGHKNVSKGFIAFVKLHQWKENKILRHEKTIPHRIKNQLQRLKEIKRNTIPTHGLYTDSSKSLEPLMDHSQQSPIQKFEDKEGVTHVLSAIADPEIIGHFQSLILHKQIIIADGHHRFETSMAFNENERKKQFERTGKSPEYTASDFHMMHFTNTVDTTISILPTHRLLHYKTPNKAHFIDEKVKKYFDVFEKDLPIDSFYKLVNQYQDGFGLLFNHSKYLIRLKQGWSEKISWPFPKLIKQLPLTGLHYFFIACCCQIKGKEQQQTEMLNFSNDIFEIESLIEKNHYQMGILVNPEHMDNIHAICKSGYTLPQKSTYFYPKINTEFISAAITNEKF